MVWLLWPVQVVRLTNESARRQVVALPARDGDRLSFEYIHSIYRQPAAEEFRVRSSGLELVALRSASMSVLEYYARSEAARADGDQFVIAVRPERHAPLRLMASEVGQRTLIFGRRRMPLHQVAANGERLTLSVERVPRVEALWPAG